MATFAAGRARSDAQGFVEDVTWIRDQFRRGVPSYFAVLGHLLAMLEEPGSTLLTALERTWRGRIFHVAYDRPLLFLAALRADAMLDGAAHPLYRAIATEQPDADAVSVEAVHAAVAPERSRFFAMLARRWVQTNETLRSVAWLWPAHLAGCGGGAKPIALVDLGASAGLNLVADRLPAAWTEPSGAALPVATAVHAVARLGLDARPVDLADPDNVTWMRACIWPGDRGRLERLEAGVTAFFEARRDGDVVPVLEQADVSAFAARVVRVAGDHDDAFVLAYQTVFRDYLSPSQQSAHHAAMYAWLASMAPGRGVWVELETRSTEIEHRDEPVTLTVHARGPSGQVSAFEIARTLHHPILVKTIPAAVRGLESVLGSWKRRGKGC